MGAKINGRGNKTKRRLKVLSERVEHPAAIWPDVERVVYSAEAEQFDSRGKHLTGRTWKRLDAAYAARKPSGQNHPLVLSGSLRASFTGQGPYAVRIPRKSSIVLGSKHPLARIHQSGSARGQVPARPILRVTRGMRSEVRDAVRDALLDG